ncbi:MAG: MFS transporter [Alphaproteobacteria bacterium]|nr:MFS transporter [Alphaproteobacteria bacterium]
MPTDLKDEGKFVEKKMLTVLEKWLSIKKNIAGFQIFLICMVMLNNSIHFPALPTIKRDLLTSAKSIQYFIIMTPFVAIFTTLGYGTFADIYQRKPLLIFSLICFLLGTALCINSSTIEILLLGRFIQVLGDSGIGILWMIILGDIYHGQQFARLQVITTALLTGITALGPFIGTLLITHFTWRANFVLVIIPVALALCLLIFWKENSSFPPVQTKSFFNPKAFMTHRFLLLSLIPVIPTGLFAAFTSCNPLIFIDNYGLSAFEFSLANSCFILANIIGNLIYIPLIRHYSFHTTLKTGILSYGIYTVMTIGFLIFPRMNSAIMLIILLAILNFSLPFLLTTCMTLLSDSYPQQRGVALSVATVLRNIGSTIIPLLSCGYFQGTAASVFKIIFLPTLVGLMILCISLGRLKVNSHLKTVAKNNIYLIH